MVTARQIWHLAVALKSLRAMLIVSSVVLAGRLLSKPEVGMPQAVQAVATPRVEQDDASTHELNWYAPLWERDLKQPPIPPVAAPAAPERPSRGPVPRLVATFVESTDRWAHLVGSDGRTVMKTLDDTIDRFVVASIEPGRVELRFESDRFWLEIPLTPQ